MIRLSDQARQDLTDFFKNKPPSPIRIKLSPGGCMGPKLTLDLDQGLPTDESVDIDGLTFVMHKGLLAQVGRVNIDADYTGFRISSERQPSLECSDGDCRSCAGSQGVICPF